MSSRFPTRLLSRSVSSSIVWRNSRCAAGVQSTSGCNMLVAAALIDASGVRRSCDTAARSAVRSSLASARPSAAAASARNRRRSTTSASWPVNARSRPMSSSSIPDTANTVSASSGTLTSASSGRLGMGSPALLSTTHRSPVLRRTAVEMHPNAERRPVMSPGKGSCSLMSVALSCASVSASALAWAASACRRAIALTN